MAGFLGQAPERNGSKRWQVPEILQTHVRHPQTPRGKNTQRSILTITWEIIEQPLGNPKAVFSPHLGKENTASWAALQFPR